MEYHTELELKLPQWLLEKVDIDTKKKHKVCPNNLCGNNFLSQVNNKRPLTPIVADLIDRFKVVSKLKSVGGGNFDTKQSEVFQGHRDLNCDVIKAIYQKQKDK